MGDLSFIEKLREDLPVLFLYVGWSEAYEGAEPVAGAHAFLKQHAHDAAESEAFLELADGTYRSGAGPGALPQERLHVVFVAREHHGAPRKVVGVYAGASVERHGTEWPTAIAREVRLLPLSLRPALPDWPEGQGVRRWACRPVGSQSPELLAAFGRLVELLESSIGPAESAVEDDEGALEGQVSERLVRHRHREQRLRQRKIDEVLLATGRLACEVPDCGFDFHATYGSVGKGFAEVHHRDDLAGSPEEGRITRLRDLAIVCANCHRMLHRGGGCRSLESLASDLARP